MQDRLKSRFFHKPSGKYLNSQSLVYCNGCYEHVADRQLPNGTYKAYILTTYNTSEIIQEQCIGLKDKNGKLIYEGDIVVIVYSDGTEGRKSIVKYGEFNCSCCDGIYGWYFDYGDIRNIEDYEVIGNINENPDLLENKDE